MGILDDYPYCKDIIESKFLPLVSEVARYSLYVQTNNDKVVFENLLYSNHPGKVNKPNRHQSINHGLHMRAKDFLASIPAFADFSDQQLSVLEQKASVANFEAGDVVFRQGEDGDVFYIISKGAVDVLIQDQPILVRKGDLGRIVNRLTEGCYFGERALMTSEKRAASIKAIKETVCLVFSRTVYEELISGSNALIGQDTNVDVDWSKDHETRSLFKHVENILDIHKMDTSPKVKRILYELSTAFTPELSPDEIMSRMVMTVKIALKVDRVGLFVLSEDKRSMVLKVSERSKGVRLPIRGLAGAVLQTNQAINIADAYQDPRFDATMDRRTGYRTRQVLGVPLKHPLTGEAMGLLQVNNRLDSEGESFLPEQQRILELAAEQLSELLLGRADVFIHTGGGNWHKSLGQGVGDGLMLLNSNDLTRFFCVDVSSLVLGGRALETMVKENVVALELQISLHLALSSLCDYRVVYTDMNIKQLVKSMAAGTNNGNLNNNSSNNSSSITSSHTFSLQERSVFDIEVRDLPRATRILIKIYGCKKKKAASSSSSSSSNVNANRVALGWTACTIYDFKGCLETVQELFFFPIDAGDREIEVPITTTLSNGTESSTGIVNLVLAPDLLTLNDEESLLSASTPRVRIVHNLPGSSDDNSFSTESESLGSADFDTLSPAHHCELARILQLSFNPLSLTMITTADKELLWELRYAILKKPELLPAFVMAVAWNKADKVQELYNLLDLWAPLSAVQALQLLDRRFMDPKVRAYAVHCLEDLPDEQLALYMLQLCQQLKFETFVDSALARFLLRRALTNQKLIGHIYFWLLQSEVYNKDVSKRYIVLLQVYIRNCGKHRIELGHQMFVMKRLEKVAEAVKEGESKEERKKILKDKLTEIVLPPTFKLPLNPHLTICGIEVGKCRVMESKKKPLWLTLKNASKGEADVVLMLKVGDDLRQDALIIQLLRVMNDLWIREGLDMKMMLYDCISTGFERGLLQVVLNATTLGSILMDATDNQSKSRGSILKSGSLSRKLGAAMKAVSDFQVLRNWITDQVKADGSVADNEEARAVEYERRVLNFTISTAAYCVASYVLGLGDRHNDNLMLTKSGHFFHIDFGHILGNFKSKLGVKRERAPFVFTPAMKYVIGSDKQYQAFLDLCCDVYNILREHSMLLVSLFSLAIPCNLPELQGEKDVMWIYEKLQVGKSDEEAADHFTKQLEVSLNTRGTRLNDAAHMLAHA